MKILPVQNYNCNSQNASNKTPSFGVKLQASVDIPKFVVKQAMNYALRNNQNPNIIANMHYNALQREFTRLQKSVDDFEPRNLSVRLDLNKQAKNYANDLRVDGHPYIGTPAQVSADYSSTHEIALPVEDLSPNPDAFYNIKFVIKRLTNMLGYDN